MKQVLMIVSGFLVLGFVVFAKETIHAAILSSRLMRLLKEKDYERWRELTTVRGFGPGFAHPSKSWPWLFRDESSEDEQFRHLKDRTRIRTRWSLITGAALAATIVTLFVAGIVYAVFFQ